MDKDLKKRYDELINIFTAKDFQGYIELSHKGEKYCIEIVKRGGGDSLRWFHQNKFLCELVHTTEDGHKNIAPFVLFSSFEDCILQVCLVEDRLLKDIDYRHKKQVLRQVV